MTGTLSIVATPIGNMQDISVRAVKTLISVDVIACEDTRRAGLLLQKIKEFTVIPSEIAGSQLRTTHKQRLISFYDQVEVQKTPEIIQLLMLGMDVALISDAGTPTVSDPGFKLIRECVKENIPIESIPGACAGVVALTLSGLPTDKFFFVGYPPRKNGHRMEFYQSLKVLTGYLKTTIIMYEAPHRIQATLQELADTFGNTMYIVLARELTKIHEEVLRGSVENLQVHFAKNTPKGEFVVLFQTEQ